MKIIVLSFCIFFTACSSDRSALYEQALQNGRLANEGFTRCERFVKAWLAEADSVSGLIPRNLNESRDYWNAWDAAADNYPFMVMTSAILRPDLFEGVMLDMLHTERKLTSRTGCLPDTWSFSKQDFLKSQPDTSDIIFGSAEYMKDGLLALTEWLGESPWLDRMIEIADDLEDVMALTPETVTNRFSYTKGVEINGDLLQVLSRLYWITSNKRYLDREIKLGDYFLNERRLPTRSNQGLRLRDHGCEIIGGLSEVYAAVHFVDPEKKKQWRPYMHEMLDCVLNKGRNEDGLFYNAINPVSGEIIDTKLADTWGYTLDAIYTVYILDGIEAYRDAVARALGSIIKYKNYNWEPRNDGISSQDGYADAIESALNLYFLMPVEDAASWIDSEIQSLWNYQRPSGVIEGWHGDGNFARTTLMYCLWKTAGITLNNWRKDVVYGSVMSKGKLYLTLTASDDWIGELKFGQPMHRTNLNLPVNYPRINQFQEWSPIDSDKSYRVTAAKTRKNQVVSGKELIDGYKISLHGNEPLFLCVSEK